MKIIKVIISSLILISIFGCHKDDDNSLQPQSEPKGVKSIHILNSTGSELTFDIIYNAFQKIVLIKKTDESEVTNLAFSYDETNLKMKSYTQDFSDGTSATVNVLYGPDGKLSGIDDSGIITPIIETANSITLQIPGFPVKYVFNDVGQVIRIESPEETAVFNVDTHIKGSLYNVDVDRILFVIDGENNVVFTKQGLNSVHNFYSLDLYFTHEIDADGYVISSQVDLDPTDPTNPLSYIQYSYIGI